MLPGDNPVGESMGMPGQMHASADDDFAARIERFEHGFFPRYQAQFQELVEHGQHPKVLFIGCSDSRVVPYLLMGAGPGDIFMVRNVGNFVPPYDASKGYHGTAAAIEFGLLNFDIRHLVVCGHSHCGAVRALYQDVPEEATHMRRWLELGADAVLPVTLSEDALRRTEQRSVILQLERLFDYPLVRKAVESRRLFLHGWHYLIEDGRVLVLNVARRRFEAVERHESGNGSTTPG